MNDFDLDKYLRASRRVDLAGITWDRVADHPLPVGEARCLAYMMDIESHTVIYLRDLLATRAALEPNITAFLSCWVYEELWHGEAFSRFLGEAGYRLAPDREAVALESPYPSRGPRISWIRRKLGGKGYAGHVATLVGAGLFRDFPALHMAWGAVNELSTLTSYQLLIEKTRHPVLAEMLSRIIKDERRHFAFYRSQARMRLGRSAQARRITRWALDHLWAPVGTGVRPQSEIDFLVNYVFGDSEGLAATEGMQATIRELPGLEDSVFMLRARAEALQRSGLAAGRARDGRRGLPDGRASLGGYGAQSRPASMIRCRNSLVREFWGELKI